ncbi:MAG TPA: transposase DNA-binding-containing protein [Clostridia bacterium]|nr:transposase DNA-binding-containing protein [Clostridia bacterium]
MMKVDPSEQLTNCTLQRIGHTGPMRSALKAPAQWAQEEFGLAQLGDQRRNKRLVNIAQHLAANPGGTLPQSFPNASPSSSDWKFGAIDTQHQTPIGTDHAAG